MQSGGFEVNGFFDATCQRLRILAGKEKAGAVGEHFAAAHIVGQHHARAAQHRFHAHEAERLIHRGHNGVVGGAVKLGHIFAEAQFKHIFHGMRQRRAGYGELYRQGGLLEKSRQ